MKRIFYFNVTYTCNNKCIFCYSHNTRYNQAHWNIDLLTFKKYLDENGLSSNDRVIINGGEPFLHAYLIEMLCYLQEVNCEVLIYTNGRRISNMKLPELNNRFRFVIPIHGDKITHDKITRIPGSYEETLLGMKHILKTTKCLLDMKVIVNNEMLLKTEKEWYQMEETLKKVPFNNDIQITKMAATIVAKRNGCPSINNNAAAKYTKMLYDCFCDENNTIKIYDTCVKDIPGLLSLPLRKYQDDIIVWFKDCNQKRQIKLGERYMPCRNDCRYEKYCISAVHEYKALCIKNDIVEEDLE